MPLILGEFKNFKPTVFDIRTAIEEHGRSISLTQLQLALTPVAYEHHFKFVDWPAMKQVVEAMYNRHELEKIKIAKGGFFRYKLKGMSDD